MPNTILINVFEVPDGQEEEFLRYWQAGAAQMRAAAGFISTRLHQSLDPGAPFRFVNVAEWESAEHFRQAIGAADFQELARRLPFTSRPALYRIVSE